MERKYKTILFDIDGTLLDFGKDQRKAFKTAITTIGYNCTEEMYNDYNTINMGLWKMADEGKIAIAELYIKRFQIFFDKYGIKYDEKEFNQILTQGFQKTGAPINGVREVLEEINGKHELVIASNGPKGQQYHRLENANFKKYFSKIFLPEEVGYNKPDKEYFDFIFQNIDNKEKSKILIIGDSLLADVNGGKKVGIDACWYNPKNKENQTDIKPDYEIKEFEELLEII